MAFLAKYYFGSRIDEGESSTTGCNRRSPKRIHPTTAAEREPLRAVLAVAALPMGLLAWGIEPTIISHLPLHPGSRSWGQAGEMTGLKECEYQPPGSKTKHAAECRTVVDSINERERG